MPSEADMKRILEGMKEQPFFKDSFRQKAQPKQAEEAKQPVDFMGHTFDTMIAMLLIGFLLSPPFSFRKWAQLPEYPAQRTKKEPSEWGALIVGKVLLQIFLNLL